MGQAIFVAVIAGMILFILRQVWKRWTAPYSAHSMQDLPPGVREADVTWIPARERTGDRFRQTLLRDRQWQWTEQSGEKLVLVRKPSRSE